MDNTTNDTQNTDWDGDRMARFAFELADLLFDFAKEAEPNCPDGTAPPDYVRHRLLSQIEDAEYLENAISKLSNEKRGRILIVARCFYNKAIVSLNGSDGTDAERFAETVSREGRLIELLENTVADA